MPVPSDARRALDLARAFSHTRDDVLGVGLGPHFVGNRPTGRPAIKFRTLGAIGDVASLPAEIGGFAVEVTRTAPAHQHAFDIDAPGTNPRIGTRHMDNLRYRPVRGGVMVRSCDGTGVGTLGCMFWSPSTGKAYGSSCIHVLVPQVKTNRGNGIGTTVYQPDIFKRWTVVGLMVMVVMTEASVAQRWLHTTPLTDGQWLICLALASGWAAIVELEKAWRRRRSADRAA